MINSLEQLQTGLLRPNCFTAENVTHRVFNLDLTIKRDLERFHTAAVQSMDIERIDNKYLLSGGSNGALCIHDLEDLAGKTSFTCKVICKVGRKMKHAHQFAIDTVQWYPFDTGIFTTSGMDGNLKLWDTNSMKPVDTVRFNNKIFCHDMSYVSTQNLIAVAASIPHVILHDPRSGSKSHELRGHKEKVTSVKWSPFAEFLLASGGTDNKIFLWDIRSARGYLKTLDQYNGKGMGSRKDLITAHNGIVNSLQFTKDGLFLISFGTDHKVRLWDVAMCSNTLVNYGNVPNERPRRISIDVCCDSSIPVVIVPTRNYLNVYELFTGLPIKTLIGHMEWVNCCAFRPNLHEIYSGSSDRMILLWSPDVERELDEKATNDDEALSDAWSD